MAKTILPVDSEIGAKLRLRRHQLGLSQEVVGRTLGVSYQQVQKYETAKDRLSASQLYELSKLLNVEITYFFQELTKEQKKWASTGSDFPRMLLKINHNLMRIKCRKKILNIHNTIKFFLNE